MFSNELKVNGEAAKLAELNGFEVKSFGFDALKEDIRQPRIVKIGAIQNAIASPTTDPIHKQRDAIFNKIGRIIDAAGADGVNVLCLQEAWSKNVDSGKILIMKLIILCFSDAICFLHKR